MKRLLLCSLLALPLFAGDPKLADLSWMSGHWSATIDGTEMEEVWLAPKGDVMTGMHRDVRANGKTFFEFLRIAQTSDGIVYLAQPKGQPPTPFKLVESSQDRVVFANPDHDFPQRILYALRDGRLCARVEGPQNGKDVNEEWCWARRN